MSRQLIKPNPGDKVKVRLSKLRCTGVGTFLEYKTVPSASGEVTVPVVAVTELDGDGYSYIYESVIKKHGSASMIVADSDILAIL